MVWKGGGRDMGTRGSRRVRHWEIKSYFMLRLKYEDKGMQSGINEFLMSCLIILWVSITPVSCLHPAPRRGGPLAGFFNCDIGCYGKWYIRINSSCWKHVLVFSNHNKTVLYKGFQIFNWDNSQNSPCLNIWIILIINESK